MSEDLHVHLKSLPAVGELVDRLVDPGDADRPRWALVEAARTVIARARDGILAGQPPPAPDALVVELRAVALELARPRLRRVVNATGVIVHTNLGRAPLSEAAIARVVEVARGYSNLEYDLEQGTRGSRHGIVDDVLCELTGAEAALVVNNNAAAVTLVLAAMAAGREVIVSRGELIEIGGSFRIPDILAQSGSLLREVGTTNRTRLSDYARAITPQTALLLKVHPSNFVIMGFTESVDAAALSGLGRERGIPVVEDLGSGCLVDLSADGLPGEPTVQSRIAAGIDVLTMSGDKLLGGPQAGIILGRREHIAACRSHPLARAFRIDKLTLAALEGTLASYRAHRERRDVPVVAMLTRPLEQLWAEGSALAERIREVAPGLSVDVRRDASRVGGGAYPERDLPTVVVLVRAEGGRLQQMERHLRGWSPAIIARQQVDGLSIDPRTLLEGDGEVIVAALAAFAGRR